MTNKAKKRRRTPKPSQRQRIFPYVIIAAPALIGLSMSGFGAKGFLVGEPPSPHMAFTMLLVGIAPLHHAFHQWVALEVTTELADSAISPEEKFKIVKEFSEIGGRFSKPIEWLLHLITGWFDRS